MRLKRKEDGAVIVFVAAVLSALILFVALAIDTGWLAYSKNQAQAAVDAAALSGVAALRHYQNTHAPLTFDNYVSVFNGIDPDLNDRNIVDGLPFNIYRTGDASNNVKFIHFNRRINEPDEHYQTTYDQANAIQVEKSYEVTGLLGVLLGRATSPVTVSAAAKIGGPCCVEPEIPVVLVTTHNATDPPCKFAELCDTTHTLGTHTPNPATGDTMGYYIVSGNNANNRECTEAIGADPVPICVDQEINLIDGALTDCLRDIETEFEEKKDSNNVWRVILPVVDTSDLETGQNSANQTARALGFVQLDIIKVNAPGGGGGNGGEHHSITFTIACEPVAGTVGGGPFCGSEAHFPQLIPVL